jgi:hypothetical protein
MESGKDTELKISVLQVIHLTLAASQHAMQSITVNCFHKCNYVHECEIAANTDTSVEEHDDAFPL